MAEVTLVNPSTWFHGDGRSTMFVNVVVRGIERTFKLDYYTDHHKLAATLLKSIRLPTAIDSRPLQMHGVVDFPGGEFFHAEYVENDPGVQQFFHKKFLPIDVSDLMRAHDYELAAYAIGEEIAHMLESDAPSKPIQRVNRVNRNFSATKKQLPFYPDGRRV